MNKRELRKYYASKRDALSPEMVEDLSLDIANQVLQLPIWDATYYHIFLSIKNKKEVDTSYLLYILQGKDKSIILSKANFKTATLQHFLLQENTRLKISAWGIPEPENGITISENQIDVVFVPLVAFDEQGNRLGYGKGFYDRFLQRCTPETIYIGLSFFSPEKKIPTHIHDVPLHYCITPTKRYHF